MPKCEPLDAWVIVVGGGYGAFLYLGTETEAEGMRAHKARWERAIARKRRATASEITSGCVSQCLNHPGFNNRSVYDDCPCHDEFCVADAIAHMKREVKP
ncbi:hypothetical protein [Lysobacter sp. Root604]|uniref:hypothetical protein n=1 Tax=Lysobacter sp. Root604 TaxID=1736568 RepID=UPI0006F22FFC|nr:hypothetical protein [Lysobacter sp. Root604]KRA15378.1 hypothetical protein ASD69_18065 [Lysobacter sp. Root604]